MDISSCGLCLFQWSLKNILVNLKSLSPETVDCFSISAAHTGSYPFAIWMHLEKTTSEKSSSLGFKPVGSGQ